MNPIHRGELENNISSATVIFNDTGDTYNLTTKPNSLCHFFDIFPVGNYDIQLRLDWSDIDDKGQPTLDADFINRGTCKHCSIKGKRKSAHHTTSSSGKCRCYKWTFDTYIRQFSIKIVWLENITERVEFCDSSTAEIVTQKNIKDKNG